MAHAQIHANMHTYTYMVKEFQIPEAVVPGRGGGSPRERLEPRGPPEQIAATKMGQTEEEVFWRQKLSQEKEPGL